MEQPRENHEHPGHIIDMPDTGDVATSGSSSETTSNHENTAATNAQPTAIHSSSTSSTNTLRSPSHYKILVSIKLIYKLSLLIASTIVLANSRHEKPQNPLFNWILCYTIGCLASMPIIFRHCFLPHPWLSRLVDRYRWLLEFFFAFWFIVGNYWVFGEKSSSEAPNLYRFCIALLVFNYIKYIGPPILFTMVLCCCRGVVNQIERAPTESINALPTYKFKLNKSRGCSGSETSEEVPQGGVLAVGTEKERTLLGEDAVCCICLANYDDNDELKELPCSHLFHVSCVDKWLKNKGFCPLCRDKVCKSEGEPSCTANASPQV